MIAMQVLLAAVILWLLYTIGKYIQRKKFNDIVHPYTGTPDREVIFIIVRLIVASIGLILGLFIHIVVCLSMAILGLIFYFQLIRLRKNLESVLLEIEYTEEDQRVWNEQFARKKKKDIRLKTKVTTRVVITNEHIYFEKRKKIPFIKKNVDNIRLETTRLDPPFLELSYVFTGLPIRKWYVYIPQKYEKQVQALLKNK